MIKGAAMNKPVVIGIAGGTGSGKTSIAKAIKKQVEEHVTVLTQDSYYKSFPDLPLKERHMINFDHPSTYDTKLLIEHIQNLVRNVPIEMPIYDFTTHLRKKETIQQNPAKIIIVEGILLFENEELRSLMDIKIFVDTDADIRIIRRIDRDIKERGRTLQSTIDQYLATVRPMHNEFVEPSKRFADIIIPEGGHNKIGIDMIVSKIKNIVG